MAKRTAHFFWGKFLFFCLIFNFIILNTAAANLSAKVVSSDVRNLNRTQSTTIAIDTTGPVSYRSFFLNNPARLVLAFEPEIMQSNLKEEAIVNRGMVKKVYCRYYKSKGALRWVKSITFILVAKTDCQVKDKGGQIVISIQNTPEQSINSNLKDELIIKDYMPKGWGSLERKQAIMTAIRFLRIKRQMTKALVDNVKVSEPSVLVEKGVDDSIRITATNLTPVDMIATGAKVLLAQPMDARSVSAGSTKIYTETIAQPAKQSLPAVKNTKGVSRESELAQEGFDISPKTGFAKASLGFLFVILGLLFAEKVKSRKLTLAAKRIGYDAAKDNKRLIEELFLKEEELQKWPKHYQADHKTNTGIAIDVQQSSQEAIKLPASTADIAERRKFPRADIRNTRGVINRALIGSKTQPFKNIRLNDISKGGLSFLVKSKDVKFRIPTIVKLYFANSHKPLDAWVRVVWEKDDSKNDGKNVGVKFTRVPKETWDKIIESFGHRLG